MNGEQIKQAAISKAKKVASAASSNGSSSNNGKKRRKQDLKPIITTEQQQVAGGNPYRCVWLVVCAQTLQSDCALSACICCCLALWNSHADMHCRSPQLMRLYM